MAAVIYLSLLLIFIFGVKNYTKRLSSRYCGSGGSGRSKRLK
ncbi:hypothetical protein [Lientehia hominis]|nr:hypothetical protein [Lientehia hominis]